MSKLVTDMDMGKWKCVQNAIHEQEYYIYS